MEVNASDQIAEFSERQLTEMLKSRAERTVQENMCSECRQEKSCPKAETMVSRLLDVFWRVYTENN